MILVIGTTGRLGREVLGQLREKGLPVRVLVQNAAQAAAIDGGDFDLVMGDIRQPETLGKAFEGVRKVFLVTPGAPAMIAAQKNVIEAAARAGVMQVVKISELGASPAAPLDHMRGNWQIEEHLIHSGVGYTIIRPQFFMQNFLFVVAPSVSTDDALYAPISEGRMPFVDLRDVAEVAVTALSEPGHLGKVYDVTGPEALTFEEVANHLSRATHRNIQFSEVSPLEAWEALVRSGLPTWYADDLIALYALVKEGKASEVTDTVAEVTGRPARTLASYLFENRDAFQTAYV